MSAKGSFKQFCIRGHKRTPDTLYKNGTCKACNTLLTAKWQQGNRELANELSKQWRDSNPDLFKSSQRKSSYKLTHEQFDNLLTSQAGRCKICLELFTDNKVPQVDHDHRCCPANKSCGKCIRGLLCRNCNTALGLFKESQVTLNSAIEYLTSQ